MTGKNKSLSKEQNAKWDGKSPQKRYEGGRCIGTLMPSADLPQILSKEARAAATDQRIVEAHKYLSIKTEVRNGEKVAYIYASRRHPDEPCECIAPDYSGPDVHDDLRMTMKLELIRIEDEAGLLG
jgi:hypothetical protein